MQHACEKRRFAINKPSVTHKFTFRKVSSYFLEFIEIYFINAITRGGGGERERR